MYNEINWKEIQKQYPIEPGVTYLNCGSFGPCPTPVIETALEHYRTLETNPQGFLGPHLKLVDADRGALAEFVGAGKGEIVFITNVTVGMNMISRGLRILEPGDEIVITNQEYGAVRNAWDFAAKRRGVSIRTVELSIPPEPSDKMAERIEAAIGAKTKLIVMSHITSPTGMRLPVDKVCAAAAERGILTAIDGAHAPGMIPVDLAKMGCDFYTGNCHKWLCAPKGAGFLYAREDRKELLDPFVVGWGWDRENESFLGNFANPGTQNLSMFLGAGAAVRYQQGIGVDAIEEHNRELAHYLRSRIAEIPGAVSLSGESDDTAVAMTAIELPRHDSEILHQALRDRRIVVAGAGRNGAPGVRISTHIYNDSDQIDMLIRTLIEAA